MILYDYFKSENSFVYNLSLDTKVNNLFWNELVEFILAINL